MFFLVRIEENLKDSLNRINQIFQNEKILTECIQDYHAIQIFDLKIGPFKRGKKYRFKFFIAAYLINKNILSLTSEERCDNIVVQRLAMQERDDHNLKNLGDKLFLNKLKEFRRFIKKSLEEGKIPKLNFDKFNSYLANLIDSRLLKLIKLGSTDLSIEDEQRFTTSERVFYSQISELVKAWRKFFLSNI